MTAASVALPLISMFASGLSGYLGNRNANQQQQMAQDALSVQQQRLLQDRAQQLRGNAQDDAQARAVNPMRQQLFSALSQRLGLPAGSLQFGQGRTAATTTPPRTAAAIPAATTPYVPTPGWQGDDPGTRELVAQREVAEAKRLLAQYSDPRYANQQGALAPVLNHARAIIARYNGGGQ